LCARDRFARLRPPIVTSSPAPIRIVLVEDHQIVRQGVRALLETSPDLVVVGEGASGTDALALLASLAPDVLIMDLSLPDGEAVDLVREIKQAAAAKVIILSMYDAPDYIGRAMAAGADGYVVKGADVRELTDALRSVYAGGRHFPATATQAQPGSDAALLGRLSARERQVLQLIAEGNTSRVIAEQLGISMHTVNAHRVNLMAKLDLHDAQGITRFALRTGLIRG